MEKETKEFRIEVDQETYQYISLLAAQYGFSKKHIAEAMLKARATGCNSEGNILLIAEELKGDTRQWKRKN